ncbi:MAG: hypothetical protein ACE5JC_06210 [Candidatus Zixiibacteriota bacterium]
MPEEAKLRVAFIWHMHQPYYKDPTSGDYLLPWVRLHGTKDYYDMVALLDDFPGVRQTFNLVPSLLEQLQDYYRKGAEDSHLKLTRKPAHSLTLDDKLEILKSFFSANPDTMINPYPRYRQLHQKLKSPPEDDKRKGTLFSQQDFLDLQVWSNLVWIDPLFRGRKELASLFSKGEGFSEEDKEALLECQKEILKEIIPKYRELEARGQIEVSISPYYHPILPLLHDSELAKEASPKIELPGRRFAHPEDVDWQIGRAVEFYSEIFGHPPAGMWPPEGGVCQEILPYFEKHGIRWIASDEEVLFKSLRPREETETKTSPASRGELFKLYEVGTRGRLVAIFRDHNLSDLIGFTYSGWEAEKAAADLLGHLHGIRESLSSDEVRESLVTIIMDGENAWEYYQNDGHDFLGALYRRLSEDDRLETVTVSEALQSLPKRRLGRLFPGSWIGGDFKIWIGHPEENLAWGFLRKTREALSEFERKKPEHREILDSCWRDIYAVEGSDWFWWFGEEHHTPEKDKFDFLFRSHLLSVYEKLGRPAPEELHSPISLTAAPEVVTPPSGTLTPKIDGLVTHSEEWLSGGRYDCARADTAIHRSEGICGSIHFGFDRQNLYLRIDPRPRVDPSRFVSKEFRLQFEKPKEFEVTIKAPKLWLHSGIRNGEMRIDGRCAFEEILEVSIPFSHLSLCPEGNLAFRLSVWEAERELERWPRQGLLEFERTESA